MDTTIRISSKTVKNKSDFLHVTYNTGKSKDAVISLDSSNFGQSGSVTWDKKSSTLSNIEKVTNWMKQSDKECVDMDSLEESSSNDSESKSLILFRCDFNKPTKPPSHFPSLFNRSTSLIDYFKNESATRSKPSKGSTVSSMKDDVALMEKKPVKNFPIDSPDRVSNNILTSDNSYTSENKSEITDEIPLSPESQKKELCHYLQLMNPADKKEIIILQNRRSSRVRNLEEQKQQFQERFKEVNDGDKEKIETVQKSTSPKSVNEVQLNNMSNSKEFSLPFPPKKILTNVIDFDNVMSDLIPKFKKYCESNNLSCMQKLREQTKESNVLKQKKDCNTVISRKTHSKKVVHKKIKKSKIKSLVKTRSRASLKSLRSNGNLKHVPIRNLVEKSQRGSSVKNKRAKSVAASSNRSTLNCTPISIRSSIPQITSPKSIGSHCEIISVDPGLDEDQITIDQILEEIPDFELLSDEYKRCLIESRILNTNILTTNKSHVTESYHFTEAPLYGFTKKDTQEVSNMCEKYKKTVSLTDEVKESVEKPKEIQDVGRKRDKEERQETNNSNNGNTYFIVNIDTSGNTAEISDSSQDSEPSNSSTQKYDYSAAISNKGENSDNEELFKAVPIANVEKGNYLEINTKNITKNHNYEVTPYKKPDCIKSLHKSLQFSSKKKNSLTANSSVCQEWDINNTKQKLKKQSHTISIDSENGSVLKAFYVGYNLILCQEFLVSFWMQTPLGNVLGSQQMWIPRGQTQRISLNNRCLQKDSMEKVICLDTSVVYIELWMKEHKSEVRQGPVADVFITLYYWKQRQNGLDKRVLQLENINGFADDVQYCVMRNFPKIIVSWHSANEDNLNSRKTFVHAYQLASDYQTISNIFDMEPVSHYVSSLHSVEDYDDLIMGCGENKISLWNLQFGNIIATIELNDIKTPLSTLWVKCDRGFLFALQQCVDRELRLVAINGINHSWKKLASYFPPEGFDRLKGVCIDNGLLLSFYDQGILCWNTETGEPVEEINGETDVIPSGAYVILVENTKVVVKHAFTHLMSLSLEES
ncbi:uncharacterized protein LOC114334576 [Diabrotica virgifera virgifera]|uniref:Uncharacterized protein n=1 Tax=Diabrotica virgifera virgifera TaxID=50390 RepID=A0ABM5ISA6_DIAVI|nr:uncharacterized protein LOC114334576 [Diabrotica virgifera virgifera]